MCERDHQAWQQIHICAKCVSLHYTGAQLGKTPATFLHSSELHHSQEETEQEWKLKKKKRRGKLVGDSLLHLCVLSPLLRVAPGKQTQGASPDPIPRSVLRATRTPDGRVIVAFSAI